MEEPILLVPHRPRRGWGHRLWLAIGFVACFAGGWIARMQYWEVKLASRLSPNSISPVAFRTMAPKTVPPARSSGATSRPELVTLLLTRTVWRDSEGDSVAYKFGALNEERSWIEDRNPFRHPEQLLVNGLYKDSDSEVWRYLGGPTRKAESWENAP